MSADIIMPLAMISGTGVVFVALGIPLWLRRVKPNHLYGFRIRATLQDEAIWYEVNALSGKQLVFMGAVCLLMGIFIFPMHLDKAGAERLLLGWCVFLMAATVWLTISGYILARRMLRERE